jgi:hypothetical protein
MDEREYLEQVQTYLKRVFTHRELMQAHGLDPQQFILTLMPLLRQSKREQAALDAAENVWLEKIADAADAQRNLFQTLRPILEKLYSENPFHPQVREWKEQLDQWAKEMPKE